MKNNEIIQFAALFAIAAALLYRRYSRRNREKGGSFRNSQGKSPDSFHSADDDYEPYSHRETKND